MRQMLNDRCVILNVSLSVGLNENCVKANKKARFKITVSVSLVCRVMWSNVGNSCHTDAIPIKTIAV